MPEALSETSPIEGGGPRPPLLSLRRSDDEFEIAVDGAPLIRGGRVLTVPGVEGRTFDVAGDDWVDLWCECRAGRDTRLPEIEIFAPGTTISMYEVLNFRNRHFTSQVFPELPLGGRIATTTFSDDWQFAPHPSLLLLRKLDLILVLGFVDSHSGFGLRLDVDHYRVNRLALDLGGPGHGLPLAAGQTWTSPRLRLVAVRTADPYEALDRFFATCPPAEAPRPLAWASRPLYCTWFDQVLRAGARVRAELGEQIADPGWDDCVAVMTEGLVREAAATIRREGLPFETILLDVGWFKAIGQWEVDESKFPNMRGLVDDLHAQGFRVVVWWHWGELDDRAEVDPRFLMGRGWSNRHGKRLFDFSAAATRNEYLPALFRRLFSDAPDCYDFDGVKTDFLADKIHPECPLEDPAWAGEENYFRRVSEAFVAEMRRHKADAAHIGAAGHPWLASTIDANRTYDVHSTNPYEHWERSRMLRHTCPGVPVVFDFHPYLENLALYFRLARESGSGVQVGNVLYTQQDPLSPPQPAGPDYWAALRKFLGAES